MPADSLAGHPVHRLERLAREQPAGLGRSSAGREAGIDAVDIE
jgi:hypothetical protein